MRLKVLGKKSFTLIEILAVIIIIGILASLAFPGFTVSKEHVLDKEAKSNLVIIQGAEKIVRVETGAYYPAAGNTSIMTDMNSNLGINLPTSGISWNYKVDTDNSKITATRVPPASSRIWTLTYTGSTATCTGTACPP